MRQGARVRSAALAAVAGAAAILAPAAQPSANVADGSPAAMRLRAIVSRAWDDSIATWKRLMRPDAAHVGMVNLRFVPRLAPNNCYGLYAGEGPAYCSGNQTVFVGIAAADKLMKRFGAQGEAGITFLIGHEIGHHIQNIHGRFHMLNHLIARLPKARADLARRFELEADCYAGVWIHASKAWSASGRLRSELLAVLKSIGDESVAEDAPDASSSRIAGHGTSEQRTRWFLRGADSGDPEACNTFVDTKL